MKVFIPHEITSTEIEYTNVDVASDGHEAWQNYKTIPERLVTTGWGHNPRIWNVGSDGRVTLSQTLFTPDFWCFYNTVAGNGRRVLVGGYNPDSVGDQLLHMYKLVGDQYVEVAGGVSNSLVEHTSIHAAAGFLGISFRWSFMPGSESFYWFKLDSTGHYIQLPKPLILGSAGIDDIRFSNDGSILAIAYSDQSGRNKANFSLFRIGSNYSLTLLYKTEIAASDRTTVRFHTNNETVIVMQGGFSLLEINLSNYEGVNTTISTGDGAEFSISPCGEYIARTFYGVEFPTTDGLEVFRRSDDGVGWQSVSITTQPGGNCYSSAWSSDSSFLYVLGGTTPYLHLYSRSGNTFTKLSNPFASGSIESSDGFGINNIKGMAGYLQGETIYRGDAVWESAIDNNMSDPLNNDLYEFPQWLEVKKINQLCMFDEFLNSTTTNPNTIETVLVPSEAGADCVALFGLVSNTVLIQRLDSAWTLGVPTAALWETTKTTTGLKSTIVELDQAMVAGEKLRIVINNSGGTAQCGRVFYGVLTDVATTEWGVEPEILGYSRINTDDFGRTYHKKGYYAKGISATGNVSDSEVDSTFDFLSAIEGIPCVWDFNGDSTSFSTLLAYGVCTSAGVIMTGTNYHKVRVRLLGFI